MPELAYLRAMRDPRYVCGVDGNFSSYFEIEDWQQLARRYVDEIEAYVPGMSRRDVGVHVVVPAFSIDRSGAKWLAVIHPLWNREGLLETLGIGEPIDFIDTFELARRPIAAVDRFRR